MGLGRAEMGIPHRPEGRYLSNNREGLQLVDPFTSSIAQVTHDRHYSSHIENIDDVYLPPHQRSRFPRVHSHTRHDTTPSPYYVAQSQRRPPTQTAFPREHSQSPATPTSYVILPSPNGRVIVGMDPERRTDVTIHTPLSCGPPERESRASSYNNSRHGSLDHLTSPSPGDTVVLPIIPRTPSSPVPSSHSSDNAGRLLQNRVPLSESLPQKSSSLYEQSFSQPVQPVPSLSRVASSTPSSSTTSDVKSDSIPSPYIPQCTSHEVRPAASAAVVANEIIGSGKLFVTDILPRQLYLHCLFHLPYFYFSRVSRIFTEADLTLEEIHEMALQVYTENTLLLNPDLFGTEPYGDSGMTTLSPAYERLKRAWEHFIDTLIKEWKTLNIISVLLLSAIMTTFQIHGAAEDPLTRYLAFWSLICALTSLLYSCLFIIQFSSMHKSYKAVQWAIEVQKIHAILWNVWVMLAMPMVWMIWSILTFIASIISFMWRARANLPSDFEFSVAHSTESGFRIFICLVLGLGVVYGILILITFWRYGSRMDEKWTRHVRNFVESHGPEPLYRSTTLPTVQRGRVNSRSSMSLPRPSLGRTESRPLPSWHPVRHPVERPSRQPAFRRDSVRIPPRPPVVVDYVQHVASVHHTHLDPGRRPAFSQPPPICIARGVPSDDSSRSIDSSLSYQSQFYTHPQSGTQPIKPVKIREMPLLRSKSAPSLLHLLIPNAGNQHKDADTTLSLESPGPQMYSSTSTSSRHPFPHHPIHSENSHRSSLSKSSKRSRSLHRSASDNLIRYSLTHRSNPVTKDPNNDTGSPPHTSCELASFDRPFSPTHHLEDVDVFHRSSQRHGESALSSTDGYEFTQGSPILVPHVE